MLVNFIFLFAPRTTHVLWYIQPVLRLYQQFVWGYGLQMAANVVLMDGKKYPNHCHTTLPYQRGKLLTSARDKGLLRRNAQSLPFTLVDQTLATMNWQPTALQCYKLLCHNIA